jgi:hypothetical protein
LLALSNHWLSPSDKEITKNGQPAVRMSDGFAKPSYRETPMTC